ncbi:(2Fe-2S)-binding protein (plasmid) [Streptomyces sp. NBC_01591]|uniref:(2Fe-2S)-binding protein n=1 Tax=Streptomyces sp. NBC_01591 TaxID=2975888 RepID=UPI002DD96F47|nr:(2Fe-2S)-binding protein [Streptomyces sp. NBC_01591]WSD73900.1 (2Fe-2S)-binding protein [Streptomyces sp. NBC_01591]
MCAHVPESDVVAAVAAGAADVEAVGAATDAGTGCGDCVVDIEDILAEEAPRTGLAA